MTDITTGWKWGQATKYVKHFYQLPKESVDKVRQIPINWGFGEFSEFIYRSKYARKNEDSSSENWHDTSLRCANGSMTIIRNHMLNRHLSFALPSDVDVNNARGSPINDQFGRQMADMFSSWDDIGTEMATKFAQMRMTPGGRGLWAMGELAFKRGSMVLNNCGAAGTAHLRRGATWTMGALMYGCGVGFDTEFNGEVRKPKKDDTFTYIIPDTREGWVESLNKLIGAYVPDPVTHEICGKFPVFDYSKIRPEGSPIRTFGGTASGPDPLKKLHQRVIIYFDTFIRMRELEAQSPHSGDATTIDHPLASKKLEIFHQLVDSLKEIDFSEPSKPIFKARELLDTIDPRINHENTADWHLEKYLKHHIKPWLNYFKNEDEKNGESEGDGEPKVKSPYQVMYNLVESLADHIGKSQPEEELEKMLDVAQSLIQEEHERSVDIKINGIKTLIEANIDRKTYDHVRLTVDIMNSIGACVVSGNVRRSSMLARGQPQCETFRLLKDYMVNPERSRIAYMSNNSIGFTHTDQYTKYMPICAEQTRINGEPGYLYHLNLKYGRIRPHHPDDPIQLKTREQEIDKASIPNPCSEIPLELFELCNLGEIPLNRFLMEHGKLSNSTDVTDVFDFDDFLRTCILLTIYCKSVSVLPTSDPLTNAVISRNHRIGISISGGAQVHDAIGSTYHTKILRAGYDVIRKTDIWLSNILGVPQSIRVTTCKPSGTISLLTGSTPGIHFCHSRYVKRRVRVSTTSRFLNFLKRNGYECEPDEYADNTVVFSFGLDYGLVRSVQEISMYEQLVLLQMYQREWADNMVSVTITFDPKTEGKQLVHAIPQFAPTIKSVSFLPKDNTIYAQMPFEEVDEAGYRKLLKPIDWSLLGDVSDEVSIPRGCTNDNCAL
jgi:ribonucleotide reductase alpha subunit